ncbi:hypothetical protein, partial [Sporisorium scitamineum]
RNRIDELDTWTEKILQSTDGDGQGEKRDERSSQLHSLRGLDSSVEEQRRETQKQSKKRWLGLIGNSSALPDTDGACEPLDRLGEVCSILSRRAGSLRQSRLVSINEAR